MDWALLFSWCPVLRGPTACQVPAFLVFTSFLYWRGTPRWESK